MQAERVRESIVVRDLPRLGEVIEMTGRDDHHRNTGRAGARDHGVAIGVELLGVKMAVRIDPHAGGELRAFARGLSNVSIVVCCRFQAERIVSRRLFKRYLPSVEKVREVKALGVFGGALFHPALWHLNRRSAAGGVAAGLFCGLIPGPFQMLGAGIAAAVFRVNLPVALATTLYTNPFTIVPLYLLAYQCGALVLGASTGSELAQPPEWVWSEPLAAMQAYGQWMLELGAPLALGLLLLATTLALVGYVAVRLLWSAHLRRTWRARKRQRASASL